MGFDLIFCSPRKNEISASTLLEYFKTRPYMNCTEGKGAFDVMYQNPSTGVYVIFNYAQEKHGDEPIGINGSGLSVAINYLRPSFFAHELMPVIGALCKAKNLLVLGPDDIDSNGKGYPKPCDANNLIASWTSGNQFAVRAASQSKILPPYLDEEKSLCLWKYMRVHEALTKKFSNDDIFVPQMVVVRRGQNMPLVTAVTWADGISALLPGCDIIILQKVHSKGFLGVGRKEEMGWIDYDSVAHAIKPYLRKYVAKEFPGLEISVVYPPNAAKAREALLRLPLKGSLEGLEGIAMDGFVDMKSEDSK